MKNPQNVTIVALTLTAAILAALLIGSYASRDAYADVSVKGGPYIVSTGKISADISVVYVIDLAAMRLNVYGYSTTTKTIEMGTPVDLVKLFSD